MKDKIIIFLIGLLSGSVISTGAFYVYTISVNKCDNSNNQTMQMPNGQPPEIPTGGNNNGQPPQIPNGDNNTNSGDNNQPPQQNNNNSNSNA